MYGPAKFKYYLVRTQETDPVQFSGHDASERTDRSRDQSREGKAAPTALARDNNKNFTLINQFTFKC